MKRVKNKDYNYCVDDENTLWVYDENDDLLFNIDDLKGTSEDYIEMLIDESKDGWRPL